MADLRDLFDAEERDFEEARALYEEYVILLAAKFVRASLRQGADEKDE